MTSAGGLERQLPALVVAIPLLGGLLLPLWGRWRRPLGQIWLETILLATALGDTALLLLVQRTGPVSYAFGAWVPPTGIVYVVDGLNAIVLTMLGWMAFLTAVWMRRGLAVEVPGRSLTGIRAVFLLFVTGSQGMVITGDVFNLYVFLEIASLTSYVLVGMGPRRQAPWAAFTYLIVGSLGAIFILLGIGHLYLATGSLTMSDLAARLPALYDSSVVRTSFAFFAVGLSMKMALFPLHGWQPSAYAQAPAALAIFLAAAGTKVAAYVLYRLTFSVFGGAFLSHAVPILRDVLLVMACGAIVLGPLMALRQDDLKRLLAYSSVGQIGYLVLGAIVLNLEGVTGGIVHFWNHAAATGALFCVAGALVFRTGRARVEDLRGLVRRSPTTTFVLLIAGASMVGIPLTAGFISKMQLILGALEARWTFVVPILLLSSLLTALYVWRLVQRACFAPEDLASAPGQPSAPRSGELPWSMRVPSLCLALACLVLGVTPLGAALARSAAEALLR